MDAARPQVRNSREGRLGDGKGEERGLQHSRHHTLFPLLSFTSTACGPPPPSSYHTAITIYPLRLASLPNNPSNTQGRAPTQH